MVSLFVNGPKHNRLKIIPSDNKVVECEEIQTMNVLNVDLYYSKGLARDLSIEENIGPGVV